MNSTLAKNLKAAYQRVAMATSYIERVEALSALNSLLYNNFDVIINTLERGEEAKVEEDICGLCGKPGANKVPHPLRWPGERAPNTDFVHSHCEDDEQLRAYAMLTDEEISKFLKGIR